jgi:hypothetical protein
MPDAAEGAMLARRAALVSPGLVDVEPGTADYSRALLVRDPDGHAVRIVAGSGQNMMSVR